MKPKIKNKIPKACIPRDIFLQAAMMRLGNIEEEIQAGYNILRKYHKSVTIFGSARTKEDSDYYKSAAILAERLASKDYAIVSGGGYGIMSAANYGAHIAAQNGVKKVAGSSIAFNIKLPHEQAYNPYATENYEFSHFAPRKIVMTLYADAYVFFPGGFGTLDELFEIMTLTQTEKIYKAPIILFGKKYWEQLDKFIKETILKTKNIEPEDAKIYKISDDIDRIIKMIESNDMYCE